VCFVFVYHLAKLFAKRNYAESDEKSRKRYDAECDGHSWKERKNQLAFERAALEDHQNLISNSFWFLSSN